MLDGSVYGQDKAPDQEKIEQLKRENEELKKKVQDYQALQEDLMAERVFQKAQARLTVYLTLGGFVIVLSGVVGIKSLIDYVKKVAQTKIDTVSQDEVKAALQAEGERQITDLVASQKEEFDALVKQQLARTGQDMADLAKQQLERIKAADQPIGQTRDVEPRAATVSIIDYSDQMLPIRNSGAEGSAVGFALAAALEYQIQKTLGEKVRISPRYIYYYARLTTGMTNVDSGAIIRDAIKVLLRKGAVAEEVWPYKAGEFAEKPPKGSTQAVHYRVTKAEPLRSLDEMKEALEKFGPVAGGVTIYESIFSDAATETGKLPLPSPKDQTLGATALCFVGFDDNQQLLKFRNQWGVEWGDHGHGYLPYEYAEKFIDDTWALVSVKQAKKQPSKSRSPDE